MKITNHQIADLQSLLTQCTNIPFENVDSFITFLDLREKLEKSFKEFNDTRLKLLQTYDVKEENGVYSFAEHPDRLKIEDALQKLALRESTISELRTLKITPVELARMTAGLKNYQMDFLKYWLVEEKN